MCNYIDLDNFGMFTVVENHLNPHIYYWDFFLKEMSKFDPRKTVITIS